MAVAAYPSSILVTAQPSIATTNEAMSTSDNTTWSIVSAPHRYFDPKVAVVVQEAMDEIQQIAITGGPTGGTFTLTFGGQTTAALNWNATAAQVQSALQALSSIGANNALCSGGPLPGSPIVVQFTAGKGQASQALMTHTDSLTGGSSPAVNPTRIQAGQAFGALVDTNFTIFRCNARIVFPAALGAGKYFQFASANYFAYSTMVEANSCEFSGKYTMEDVTTFGSSPAAKGWLPTTLEGTIKLGSFWISQTRASSLVARDLLVVSFVMPNGTNRYEGFVYASDLSLKYDPKKAVVQDISLTITNEFFTI